LILLNFKKIPLLSSTSVVSTAEAFIKKLSLYAAAVPLGQRLWLPGGAFGGHRELRSKYRWPRTAILAIS